MRSLILVVYISTFLFLLYSCDHDPRSGAPPLVPVEFPAGAAPKHKDPLEQAKADMLASAEKAAQSEARYETLKKQASDDILRSQTMWISGICLLLAAVAGVLAFVVPLGKKTLVAAAVGFTTIAACAQAFQAAVPYLPWIGGTLIVGGGLWAAISWRKLGGAVKAAAAHGDRIEEWLQDLPEEAREQANKIMSDAKAEQRKYALAAGVNNEIQYLRGKIPSLWQRITDKIA